MQAGQDQTVGVDALRTRGKAWGPLACCRIPNVNDGVGRVALVGAQVQMKHIRAVVLQAAESIEQARCNSADVSIAFSAG
jgi:hypothetical protein